MVDSITFGESVIDNATGFSENMMRQPEMPFMYHALEAIPNAPAAMGHFIRRGSNTILGGGYRGRNLPGGDIQRGLRNNNPFNPRNWNRMENIDPFVSPAPGKYNPFFMSRAANAATNWATGGSQRMAGSAARVAASESGGRLASFMGDEQLTQGGFMSRATASSKIGLMSDARFARMDTTKVTEFLRASGMSDDAARAATQTRGGLQRGILGSAGGAATGYAGGFLAAFTEGATVASGTALHSAKAQQGFAKAASYVDDINRARPAGKALQLGKGLRAGRIVGHTAAAMKATQGLGAAAKIGGKGAALLGARAAGFFSPLMPLMTAWAVFDIAKFGVKLAGKGIQTGLEGYKSFQGNLNGRLMDPGFIDTEAAMTSRARGVMAIQNSRLNARSVLGSEAGAMASHFG